MVFNTSDIIKFEKKMISAYKAYKELNRIRFQKTLNTIVPESRAYIEIIPLLLHVNSEGLPGYVGDSLVPNGLANFEWTSRYTELAQDLFPEANIKKQSMQKTPLECLALMGSCGSIAMTKTSDFDFWLCVQEKNFAPIELKLLAEKTKKIEAWGETKNLEIHFFINDIDEIKSNRFGKADEESSGSALGLLLKEEFYRSFIIVGGKFPFWCLTPADADDNIYHWYYELLENSEKINKHAFIDLGNVTHIPEDEYYGATLWQIVKGYKNPFKSLLKIGCLEVYYHAAKKTDGLLMCNEIKKAVHNNSVPLQFIDPYITMFETLINFNTKHGNKERDRLLKICFYLKTNFTVKNIEECLKKKENLESKMKKTGLDWHEINEKNFMDQFVKWGWNSLMLENLNNFNSWPFDKIKQLSEEINKMSLDIYRNLTDLLSQGHIKHKITDIDITVLGRKIQAIYRKFDEKIESIHHIKDNHIERILSFIEADADQKEEKPWLLFKTAVSKSNYKIKKAFIIHKANNLYELIFWMVHNDIYRPNMTSLLIKAQNNEYGSAFVKALADNLFDFFKPVKISAIKNEILLKKPVTEKLFLLCVPSLLNDDDDPKSTDEIKNLIAFKRNSWGEEFIKSYTGKNILSLVIRSSENNLSTAYSLQPSKERIRVFTPPKALLKAITKNEIMKKFRYSYVIVHFFNTLKKHLYTWLSNSEENRETLLQYAYISDGQFRILLKKNKQIFNSKFSSFDKLVENLSTSSSKPVLTWINLHGHTKMALLSKVFSMSHKKSVSVFVNRGEKIVDLFITDAIGNLYYKKIPSTFFSMNLKTTHLFLISSIEKIIKENGPEHYLSDNPEKIIKYLDITVGSDPNDNTRLYNIIKSDQFNFISLSIEKIRTGGFFFQLDGDEIFSTKMYNNPNLQIAKKLLAEMKKKKATSFFVTSAFLEKHFKEQTCPGPAFLCHYLLYRKLLSHHLVSLIKKL